MEKCNYVILGAGPAGLTFANLLKQAGETSFCVLEKQEIAGGLCRSVDVDGSPLDVGGGHFLDVRRPKANKFLFQFMPEEEWDLYERDSKINLGDVVIDHPIEANIWQMDIERQVEYLKSIAVAGCNQGEKIPKKFTDWIYWKLGNKIAEDYMIPYNSKMFSKNLDELGTYWLDKLPNVSFENTLHSCLEHKAFGEQPGHAKFYYPKKFGYGEVWLRMADAVKEHMKYKLQVEEIDFDEHKVKCSNGETIYGKTIITTIPWKEFKKIQGMPQELQENILQLKHNSVDVEYHADNLDTDAHWVYYPDNTLNYHRILVRHNFCPNSRGYWTETNVERVREFKEGITFRNEYAYPLNTICKPEIMDRLIGWCEENQVYPLGRWGEHQHYNSDVTVMKAMKLFEKLNIF